MSDPVKEQKERERRFREAASPFGEFVVKEKTRWWNEIELGNVFTFMRFPRQVRLLDAGCSDGRFLEFVRARRKGSLLVGLDFAVNPLKAFAQKNANTFAVCGDVSALPLRDGMFSHVVSLQVIPHLSSRGERLKAFREAYRSLEPRGRFAVLAFNRASWKGLVENGKEGPLLTAPDLFVFLYDPDELAADLRESGFFVERVAGTNSLPVRYLKVFRLLGVWGDIMITRFFRVLSLRKGRYLLAVCRKN
jgi:SAM-dependent methyltransferase